MAAAENNNMNDVRQPTLLDALIPIISLVVMLAMSVYLFGDNSSSGPNQIVLTLGAAIAAIVAIQKGTRLGRHS